MTKEQYALICARRQGYDTLLWQTPALAMAAQAFLLGAAFNSEAIPLVSLIFSIFALIIGTASVQLLVKLRYLENWDSVVLRNFETSHSKEGLAVLHGPREPKVEVKENWISRVSSFRVWLVVLVSLFALASLGIAVSLAKLLTTVACADLSMYGLMNSN